MMQRLTSCAIGLCLVAATGCAPKEPWALTTAASPSPLFVDKVYPVLLRDCAFFACHGSEERLFQVWGPKRRRLFEGDLSGDEERSRIAMELKQTYMLAISFVDINDPARSLLLRKGLDPQAGGTGHLGLDKFGRNVYRSGESPGYLALSEWVYSLRPDDSQ